MIQAILCALFALCTGVSDPTPASPRPVTAIVDPIIPGQIIAPPALDAQVITVAVPVIARWEGLPCDGDRCAAYLDRIASPPVWTICHGETRGVRQGDVRTRAECMASLEPRVAEYWQGIRPAFTPETLHGRLSAHRAAAFTDLSYNAGIGAVRGSTAMRRINAGDIRGACIGLTWYNRAGGRIIIGLENRRAHDYELCMTGLN